MAVADITFSIFHISELSFRNISNKPEGMSGPGFCFLRISPIQWIGATCSTLSLVLIAFERYFVVRNPHGNQKLSREKLKARIFFFHSFLGRRKPDSDVVGKPIHAWRYEQNQVNIILGRIIANEHTHSLKLFELFKPKLRQHYIIYHIMLKR